MYVYTFRNRSLSSTFMFENIYKFKRKTKLFETPENKTIIVL